jgi:methylase of polypeptide subunit release factors
MKVMLCGPFSGAMSQNGNGYRFDAQLKDRVQAVNALLIAAGFDVLSAHQADDFGERVWVDDFCERDLKWCRDCDVQVVLMPVDQLGRTIRSDGTMVEVGYAHALEKPQIIVLDRPLNESDSFFVRALLLKSSVTVLDWTDELQDELPSTIRDTVRKPRQIEFVPREHRTDADQMLDDLRKESDPHSVLVADLPLTVLPGVLSPRFSHAPDSLMAVWDIPKGSSVLDLGCGCGVLGLAALAAGAANLTALDVNPTAVKNTQLNIDALGWSDRAIVRHSDVYSGLHFGESFDIILFAAPYWNKAPVDDLERSCFDEDYRFLDEALNDARQWLRKDGAMYVIFSDQGDVGHLCRSIGHSGLSAQDLRLWPPTQPGGHIRMIWKLNIAR